MVRTARVRWALWLLGLGGAGWLVLFGDKPAPVELVGPTPRPTTAGPEAGTPAGAAASALPSRAAAPARAPAGARSEPLALLIHRALLASAASPRADLFAAPRWAALPPPSAPPSAAAPLPVPTAEHTYKVLGKKQEGQAWEVFLGRAEQSFVVRAGDTLEGTWRIERIQPPEMTWTHLPSGQQQTMPIHEAR